MGGEIERDIGKNRYRKKIAKERKRVLRLKFDDKIWKLFNLLKG